MNAIVWMYRCGLLGFLTAGGLGAFNSGTNSTLADTPAIWSASNAIANAFQGGLAGVAAGGLVTIVIALNARSNRRHAANWPKPEETPVNETA